MMPASQQAARPLTAQEEAEKPLPLPVTELLAQKPDNLLMEVIAQGDRLAFRVLMERHLAAMVAVAQRLLANSAEADEVVQEGFLRLWTHAARWDPDGPAMLKTWLTRVVVNLALDRLRKRRTAPLEEAGEIEDTSLNAFDLERRNDCARLVEEALGTLPERQRIAIVLSYFEDYPDAQVARLMDTSVRAVESLLVRARRGLRAALSVKGITGGHDI